MEIRFKHTSCPLLLVTFSMLFLAAACAEQPATIPRRAGPANPAPLKTEIVIAAVGDVMMPSSIQSAAQGNKSGYDLLFEKVAQDLSAADITVANLETTVDHRSAISGYPKFNAGPGLLVALKKAGVDVVSIANNHTMDAGPDGLKRTLDNIEAAGLLFIGAGRTKAEASAIKYMKARGVNVAFLSYTYGTNQRLPRKAAHAPGVNIIGIDSEAGLARAGGCVRQARAAADLVVVSMHWGEEYEPDPTAWQRRIASALVDAGADIILGHHPHVLQPIESRAAADGRMGLTAFSLGNFISSQNAGVTYENKTHRKALRGDGIILNITVVKEDGRTRVAHAEFLPIWTLRDTIGKAVVYRPVTLAREIARIEAMPKRTKAEENSLKLLSYRMRVISDKLMASPAQ